MAKNDKRKALGRGLSALMADINVEEQATTQTQRDETHVPTEKLFANPDQPRREFREEDLQSLTASIAEKGIIQPLIVRRKPNSDQFEIVAGERRWRAAQRAKLHQVPVVVRDFSDTEVLEVAIIENIQRADLNAVEEAMGYRQLMDRFGHTQEKLSEVLGKSRSHIANLLRLLGLPNEVLGYLKDGKLSSGHARALVSSDDPVGKARRVIAEGLSVRQTEVLAKTKGLEKPVELKTKPQKDADTRSLEADLSANLSLKVLIDHKSGSESGQVKISYKTLDDLDRLCQILSKT